MISGDLFFLKTPSLPLVVGVVDKANLEVELVEAAGERSLEAERSLGVDRNLVAAENFFWSLALGAGLGDTGFLGVGGLVLFKASTRSNTGEAG